MNKKFSVINALGFSHIHTPEGLINLQIDGDERIEVADEYHTMHELYEHRMALNIALFNMIHKFYGPEYYLGEKYPRWHGFDYLLVGKSKLHNDGTMFEGYFVVFASGSVKQISYHYHLKHWDKFKIPEYERVPFEYDNHTSNDVIERLIAL